MALAGYALPFGLRQVKLTPINDAGALVPGSAVFLPASRTFSFSETESFEELAGDDTIVASHGAGPVAEWDLEGGGISLAIWRILSGGTITDSGSTPNAVKTFSKLATDSRPYFQVEGRAISDNGGDFQATVFRCKADGDLEAAMENGSFLLTAASGKGYGRLSDNKLYEFAHRETAVPLASATAKTGWTLTLGGSPAGGTYRLVLNGIATADIAYNAINTAIAAALNALSAQTGLTGITVTGTSPTFTVTLPSAGTLWVGTNAMTPGTATLAVA